MSYERTNWVNGETPINADNLNNMEEGIVKAHENMLKAESMLSTLSSASITADTVEGFLTAVGSAFNEKGIENGHTESSLVGWSGHGWYHAFASNISNAYLIMTVIGLAEKDFYGVQYVISTGKAYFEKYATGTDLAKYLLKTGDTLTGTLNTKQLQPTADSKEYVGVTGLAYLAMCANHFGIFKGGQNYGSMRVIKEGTESEIGYSKVFIGNAIKEGTARNSIGAVAMYGKGSGYTQLYPTYSGDSNINLNLPSTAGTLALQSDITALNTLTTHEQEVVDHFISNVFPSQAVSTTSVPSGIFLKDGYTAWHGIYPVENYASYVVHGYNMRCLHLSLLNGTWTTKVMDNAL